jgi:hypothetical protein
MIPWTKSSIPRRSLETNKKKTLQMRGLFFGLGIKRRKPDSKNFKPRKRSFTYFLNWVSLELCKN